MNDFDANAELVRLLELLANETITPADHARLQELLRTDPAAQEIYFAFTDLQLGLQRITRAREAKAEVPACSVAWDAPAVPPSQKRSARSLPAALVVAASLFVAVIGWVAWRSGKNDEALDPIIVQVSQTAGAVFFNEASPTIGSLLTTNKPYSIPRGVIELRFPLGERIIVDGPAIFEITGKQRMSLRTGSCSVDSPTGVTGFVVDTPANQVVDLGTRLSVNVSENGVTDVQVEQGAAEVRQTKLPAPATKLHQGEAIRFDFGETAAPESVAYDGSRYRSTLPDRVVSYRTNDSAGLTNLVEVTVQRGGQHRRYSVNDLIGVEMIHFCGGSNLNNLIIPIDYPKKRSDVLSNDVALNTSPANPGGSREPLQADPVIAADHSVSNGTPGLGVRFRRPVVNDAGPDVVFFELQETIHPMIGDLFHVSPLRFSEGLHSYSVLGYDIDLYSPAALILADFGIFRFARSPRSLEDFVTVRAELARKHIQFRGLAVGIDLSDLGYPEGASVDGLFFQDAADGPDVFDPAFIGGLPPLKSPAAPDAVSTQPRAAL